MRGHKGSTIENLMTNTNLSQEDIKGMGRGFYGRLSVIRRQMMRWNEAGYSFRQVASWNTEDHKKDSKIPRRQLKAFWREVDLLKRIVLLAEFCKANGLDFQTEFEKHKVDVYRERVLAELMEKYEKIGVTYDMLKPFLLCPEKQADKLNPKFLDRVSLLVPSQEIKGRVHAAWLEKHPDDRCRQPFHVWDGKSTENMDVEWIEPLEVLEHVAANPKGIGPNMNLERQEFVRLYLSVRRRVAAENLTELRNNIRSLEQNTQSKRSKQDSKAAKPINVVTR